MNINYINESVISAAVMRRNVQHNYTTFACARPTGREGLVGGRGRPAEVRWMFVVVVRKRSSSASVAARARE